MRAEIYKSLWGMQGSLEGKVERIAAAGYDGFECAPQEIERTERIRKLADEHSLQLITLIYTEGDHFAEFDRVTELAVSLSPNKILAHAGSESMSTSERLRFFEHCLMREEQLGIPIAHETHRRRPLFSPMATLEVLHEIPSLKLNVDYSHWCCVTESLLQSHSEAITASAANAIHIHGRVGFENGPQVPDPRWPQWQAQLEAHEKWWDDVLSSHQQRGETTITFCPEYGPPSYQHTGSNGEPLSDLWDICLWGAERFREQVRQFA